MDESNGLPLGLYDSSPYGIAQTFGKEDDNGDDTWASASIDLSSTPFNLDTEFRTFGTRPELQGGRPERHGL